MTFCKTSTIHSPSPSLRQQDVFRLPAGPLPLPNLNSMVHHACQHAIAVAAQPARLHLTKSTVPANATCRTAAPSVTRSCAGALDRVHGRGTPTTVVLAPLALTCQITCTPNLLPDMGAGRPRACRGSPPSSPQVARHYTFELGRLPLPPHARHRLTGACSISDSRAQGGTAQARSFPPGRLHTVSAALRAFPHVGCMWRWLGVACGARFLIWEEMLGF